MATERTPLLEENGTEAVGVEVIEGVEVENGGVNGKGGSLKSAGSSNGDGDGDEEEQVGNGEINPLWKGNKEMVEKLWILFPAVGIGVLLSAADQTIIVSSYGKIGSELQCLNNTSWIATSYFLTLTSFQPLYGKLSDIFGRKNALLFAYTVFGVGCFFCGLARNLGELVAARAFAGIGGGGMTTVVSILLSDIIPLRERGSWQGYMNIVYAFGASAGAPIGGMLADTIGWRWAFILQFPMTLIASATVYFVLHLPAPTDSHWVSKLRQIDFLGAISLTTAVSALLIGLDLGSNNSWSSPLTITFCLVSLPLFALFILIEMKIATHPFAPGHIIFSRSLFASYLTNFFNLSAYMGLGFYIPLYFQAVDNLSATAAGVRLIPALVLSVTGSIFAGKFMQRTGKYYALTLICQCLCIIGSTTIFLFSGIVFTKSWVIILGQSISAFGGGAIITTTLISVIANAEASEQAIATACTYLFRSLGSVVGVSITSTVVQQRLRVLLEERLGDGKEAQRIVEKVRQSLDFINGLDDGVREVVRGCYQKATGGAFGVSIGIVCVALIISCFIKEKKLSK